MAIGHTSGKGKVHPIDFTCTRCNKISYSSKAHAKKVLLKMKLKHNQEKQGYFQTYKCPHDNRFYHIGHSMTMERN